MYYGLIVLSVVLFGGCFAVNDIYQKQRGNGLRVALQFSLGSAAAGAVMLFILNGFTLAFTPFTLLMALISAINSIAFTFCAFKALGTINLSLFSLFSMLGGMLLPSLSGLMIFGEPLTLAKLLCYLSIGIALSLMVKRDTSRGGGIYYIGVFVLNGMSGVLSKIFTAIDLPKTAPIGYTTLESLCTVLLCALLLLTLRIPAETAKPSLIGGALSAANGITNKLANFLLVTALLHVDASVQYPMVTGGTIIVSTLICCFGKNKPTKREILAVAVAFIGLLLLFVIPI